MDILLLQFFINNMEQELPPLPSSLAEVPYYVQKRWHAALSTAGKGTLRYSAIRFNPQTRSDLKHLILFCYRSPNNNMAIGGLSCPNALFRHQLSSGGAIWSEVHAEQTTIGTETSHDSLQLPSSTSLSVHGKGGQ